MKMYPGARYQFLLISNSGVFCFLKMIGMAKKRFAKNAQLTRSVISGFGMCSQRAGAEIGAGPDLYTACHYYHEFGINWVIPKKWLSRKPQEDGVFLISPAAFFGITF
jgi:hypothetical protein